MKKTITEQVTKEVEVSLPYFSKSEHYWFMIFGEGETDSVAVSFKHCGPSIETFFVSNVLKFTTEDCTMKEFESAYCSAKKQLDEIVAPHLDKKPLFCESVTSELPE